LMEAAFQVVRRGNLDFYRASAVTLDLAMVNEYGQSLLHEAVAFRQAEIALDLVLRGIDVNIVDYRRQSALHFLGFHQNAAIAERVLGAGGDVSARDTYGNTPLWYAVFNARGNYDYVKLLLAHGADATSKNAAGRSPMDFAVQIGDEALMGLLR